MMNEYEAPARGEPAGPHATAAGPSDDHHHTTATPPGASREPELTEQLEPEPTGFVRPPGADPAPAEQPEPAQAAGEPEPARPGPSLAAPEPEQPELAQPELAQPELTGHPMVDASLRELAMVAGAAPADQLPAFQAAHRTLHETLASIDEG